jgi:hypothetical protein
MKLLFGSIALQTKPAGKRCILGQGERFGGHVLGQTRMVLMALRHDRLLPLAVDLLLHPIGGCNKAIKACEGEEQPHQANATGANLDTDQMARQDQAMQEGKTRRTVTKGHASGTRIEALVVGLPGLERAAGHMEQLGCLPMGEPLRLQIAIAQTVQRGGFAPSVGDDRRCLVAYIG